MSSYQFSTEADADLEEIAYFTIERFGIHQARKYREELDACCRHLAQHPGQGISAGELSPTLRRHPFHSHMIFYKPLDYGILVVRVLHQNRDLPSQFQLPGDAETDQGT